MADFHLEVGPGKTSPRLIEDLLDYDPSRVRRDGRNVLVNPAGIYRQTVKYPPRRLERDCRHKLWRMDNQTHLPKVKERPTQHSKYVSASYCEKCLYHFDVMIDYTRRPDKKTPCFLESPYPLHHFRHFNSEYRTELEIQKSSNRYDNCTEVHDFICSAPDCPAIVHIRISPPRLNKEQLACLMDTSRLYSRGKRTIDDNPERYHDSRPQLPAEVLGVLRTYLNHALQKRPDEKRRIAVRNRRFLLAFSDECNDLLEYLGFSYLEEPTVINGVEETESYWTLPNVEPPSDDPDELYIKSDRQFLEDVIAEISTMITSRPPDELRISNVTIGYQPLPAVRDLRKALGCDDYPTEFRPINLEVDEHPHYASVGCVGDFTDELIIFAYHRQRDCDPGNIPYYLECLEAIGKGRNSALLQEEYVKAISLGEITQKEIDDAYKFFALSPNANHAEDHIIGIYRSYIESSPKHKDAAKQALMKLGQAKGSLKIQAVANDKAMSYEDALEYFGVVAETPSDVVEAQAIGMAVDGDKAMVARALQVIANHRNDYSLQLRAAAMENGNAESALTPDQAYKALQIKDSNTSDESVFTYFQTLINDAPPGSKTSFTEALWVIARTRNSEYLFAKLRDPNAVVKPQRGTENDPVGLANIGNTCYLNSLLQYYFTVKTVRDIVLNFEEYRMPLTAENILKKRVGGRAVRKEEIVNGHAFVQALQTLFKGLITSSARSVKPTVDLAELTLVSSETDANFRRASISSPQRNFSVLADRPVFGPELPPPPPPPSCPPPPIPTRPSPPLPNEVDIEMIDRPQKEPLPLDDDSDTTLIDIEPKQEQDQPNGSSQDETLANVSISSGTITPGTETNDQQDVVMTNGAPLTPPPETNLKIPERKPPVPPRNKPSPIKIKAESNDATRTRTQRLEFGAQQDVTEVIGNVMFRLQCAIKATSIDPRFGEQIDKIRETFFGANAVYLKKGQSYDIKVEDWANLIIFPAADGPRDIYEALDVVFDEQVVEIDKTTTTQFASIKKLPPIVQIQIQRTAFDAVKMQASKNPNRILFDETIYLDRYMDSDKILQRRKDSWKWKQRIRALEARQKALLETPVKAPITEVLEATKNFINLLEEEEIDGIDVDPKLSEVLEQRKEEIAQELELVQHQIATLRTKLQDQFMDMRQQRYRLQAVFIHRGSSNYGHYWIYIYDFARDIWREYNDERVSVVDDRNKIFDPSGSNGATPYYLVYVRDEDKDDLVDAVCREIAEDNTEEDVTEVWESGVDDAVEIRNGSSQHIEDYSAFQPVQNTQEVSELSGIGAWETVVKPEANPQDKNFQWQL